ncbi:DUF916 domain-containing protein [Streptomyces sp. NPDC097619]|uniref:WxL protein peptidoglycan domain-containing protein n=1 Tax=Streptomyces sp. NPDC097619 TaxID=3157228 RepID=UPI00331BE17D
MPFRTRIPRTGSRTRVPVLRRTTLRARTPLYGLLLAALLTLGQLVGPVGTGTARAADNGSWGVFPTPGAGRSTAERAYFFHQGEAGSTVTDSVTVSNTSEAPITFRIFATDAVNTPDGGAFALLPVETRPTGLGTWITLPEEVTGRTVTVPAKGRTEVPFTVTVPEDASPGDHVGGIVALNTEVEGIKKEGKVQVGVRRSVGARIYFRVPGPLTAAVGVEDVRITREAPLLPWTSRAPATVTYTLVNRGNVVLDPRIAVRAQGVFGRTLLDRPAKDLRLSLLPGHAVRLTETWADAPQLGRVTLRLTATSEGHPDLRESGTAGFWAVPWPALGVLLLLLGTAIGAWSLKLRRLRQDRAPDGTGAEPELLSAP